MFTASRQNTISFAQLVLGATALLGIFVSSTVAQYSCQGRCQYGVEGSCRPKQLTYGHYQATWRKWPVPPPVVPERMDTNRDDFGLDIELPEAFDESDPNPEFPHLRERASGASSTPSNGADAEVSREFMPDDSPMMEPMTQPAIDLPDATMEGPSGNTFYQPRQHSWQHQPAPQPRVAKTQWRESPPNHVRRSPAGGNPLRSRSPIGQMSYMETIPASPTSYSTGGYTQQATANQPMAVPPRSIRAVHHAENPFR